jgi:hypothetical protein
MPGMSRKGPPPIDLEQKKGEEGGGTGVAGRAKNRANRRGQGSLRSRSGRGSNTLFTPRNPAAHPPSP